MNGKSRRLEASVIFSPPFFVFNPELMNVALLFPEFGGGGGGGTTTKALSHGYHFGISMELLTKLVVPSPLPNPGKMGFNGRFLRFFPIGVL